MLNIILTIKKKKKAWNKALPHIAAQNPTRKPNAGRLRQAVRPLPTKRPHQRGLSGFQTKINFPDGNFPVPC